MINGKFESQKEIYEALLAGKKICQGGLDAGTYIELTSGWLCWHDGDRYNHNFDFPSRWSIYEGPKYEKWYRCLVRRAMRTIAHTEYRKDTSSNDVLKVYDDFILIDGDGKLVEESK